MAKTFLKQEPKKEPVVGSSILSSLLVDDDEQETVKAETEENEGSQQVTLVIREDKKEVTKVQATKPERRPVPKKPEVVKEIQSERVDKRKVEDKKVVFTNSIRGTLKNDIDKLLPEYRRKVDIDYNLAQLLEDAIVAQLEKMKSKI
jgi:hypothetical protein